MSFAGLIPCEAKLRAPKEKAAAKAEEVAERLEEPEADGPESAFEGSAFLGG